MTAPGIGHLRLYNFRNYATLELDLEPGLNLFIGENAQGKTNLLEAVATLLLTRSPRSGTPAELLRWGTDEAAVDAAVGGAAGPEKLGLRLRRHDPSGRVLRSSLLEDKPAPARAILGRCPVVLFWPDDLQLVKAGPDARRRQIDTLLAQLDPVAGDDLSRYRRVLEQRNALLRQPSGGDGHASLAAFDEALARHGARVRVARRRLVEGLAPLAGEAMAALSGGRERLELRYREHECLGPREEGEIAACLMSALRAARSEELSRGMTLVGPHRDDLEYEVDGRPARTGASQGQQRTAVLAAKLAELRYARIRSGRLPLLLLDDVLSELDPRRGAQLLDSLNAAEGTPQTLITTTEQPAAGAVPGRRFQVAQGTVRGL